MFLICRDQAPAQSHASEAAHGGQEEALPPLSWPPPPGLHVVSPEQVFGRSAGDAGTGGPGGGGGGARGLPSRTMASMGDRMPALGDLMESLVQVRGSRVGKTFLALTPSLSCRPFRVGGK